MDYYYALTYSKSMYNVEEACRDFVEENKFLILEEGTRNVIILSPYDFEDFNFIKGE